MFGDAEFQLQQVEDLLRNKLTKRNVDVRFLDIQKAQKIGGDKVKQVIKVKTASSPSWPRRSENDEGKQAQGASAIQEDRFASPEPSVTTCKPQWPDP